MDSHPVQRMTDDPWRHKIVPFYGFVEESLVLQRWFGTAAIRFPA
jgi:hypothetical protein